MPKTNKICMYFDKDELKAVSGWISTYFQMCEDHSIKESHECSWDNNQNKAIVIDNCNCKECVSVSKMTEELFWKRVSNLWKIYTSITDDLVYRAMWEKKLKELMEKGFEK